MTVSAVSAGSLQFGRVFKTTFGVIGRNPVTLAVISLAFGVVPTVFIERAHVWFALPPSLGNQLVVFGCDKAARLIPMTLAYSAGSFVVSSDIGGKKNFSNTLSSVAATFPGMLITYALFTLGIYGGFILLIVPAIVLYVMWVVALPVSALERRWTFAALKRSAQLTKSHRGAIFGLVLAASVPFVILFYVGYAALGALGFSTDAYGWPMIAFRAVDALFSYAFGIVLTPVLYFELRRLHDGLLTSEADVFD